METLEKIKHSVCKELSKMANMDSLNTASLDAIDKLTHTLKSIETIMAMRTGYTKNDTEHSLLKETLKEINVDDLSEKEKRMLEEWLHNL